MFIGEYRHTIDKKRRVAIPAKFRKNLGSNAIIAKGLEGSLSLYPFNEWKKLGEKLTALPMGQAKNRSFVRMMLAGASDVNLDGLGRILIPDYLAEHAKLKKNVVMVGVLNRIEFWDEKRWETYKKSAESKTQDIAERLGQMGAY